MASNAMLCRWSGGWHEVIDSTSIGAHGRRECLLGIGAVQSIPQVESIAQGQLGIFANVRQQFTTTIETRDESNMPYWAVGLGDQVTVPDDTLAPDTVRMLSVTVTEDAEGFPIFAPQLNDLIFQQDEATANAIKKMSNGTVGGNSTVAQPAAFIATPTPNCCPPPPPGSGG